MIDEIMEYNRKFVENKGYEPKISPAKKYPDKKLAILTLYGYPPLIFRRRSASKWRC